MSYYGNPYLEIFINGQCNFYDIDRIIIDL